MNRFNLLERANEILRERALERLKRSGATGWENGTVGDLAHYQINNEQIIAALEAINDVISNALLRR